MEQIDITARSLGNWPDFLDGDVDTAARRLLGCYFVRELDGKQVIVRIVETEAYDQTDEASHSFKGKTARTEVMFGPSGHLYVYFTYGVHYCANVVCGPDGYGAGVLIRAVEPVSGIEALRSNRPKSSDANLTNGPGKLCQALQIDFDLRGHSLKQEPMKLVAGDLAPSEDIVKTTRIGISKEKDSLRRFYIKDNPYVSRY